jgi:hypothetical protein
MTYSDIGVLSAGGGPRWNFLQVWQVECRSVDTHGWGSECGQLTGSQNSPPKLS